MRQAEKEKKKIQSRISFLLDPGKKIPNKIAKKFEKLKNLIPALFLSETGLYRPRKREKNFGPELRTIPTRFRKFKKNSKKNRKLKKKSFWHYFYPIRDEIGRERGKKKIQSRIPFLLDPGKKIPKKIAKKFENFKNIFLELFLSKSG